MPALKNVVHERFVQSYPRGKLSGLSAGTIFLQAGGIARSAHAADVAASRLLQRQDVLQRLAEIGAPATRKAKIDAANLLDKFERVIDDAHSDKQFGVATRAIELQARMTGALVDKSEAKITASVAFDTVNSVDDVFAVLLREMKPSELIETLTVMINEIEKMAADTAEVVEPRDTVDHGALAIAKRQPRGM